jgi:hypothetical protein
MSGQFNRLQRTARPLRAGERGEITAGAFHIITTAEVRETGGQGSFRVKLMGNDNGADGLVTVRQLSPHASYRPSTGGGDDVNNFEDSQTASAMVTPTPQVGTMGVVIIANERATEGFWIGSIIQPGLGQTFPDFARSENATGERSDLDDFASPVGLPAGEVNRSTVDGRVPESRTRRAVHPFARVLQRQGLLVDTVRGQTTSSFLRDTDSRMIGFNTPGGVGQSQDIMRNRGPNYEVSRTPQRLVRLGGHTFTMDDGDDSGNNNLVRIRSSKGAQILFHDTEELVYIGNQNGTAWIEMTSDGKIDMYAKDSVSIHSEADFNFRADRDINFEAGRNLNMKGVDRTQIEADELRVVARIDGVIDIRGDLDFVSTDLRIATNDLSVSSTNLNISNKVNTNIRSGELDLVTQFGMRTSHGTGLEIKTNVLENQIWNAQTYNPERTYYKGETVIFGTQFYRALTQNIVPNTPGVKVPPAPGLYWEIIPPVIPKTIHGDVKIDTNVAGPMLGNIDIHAKGKVNATSITGSINLKAFADNINIQTPQTVFIDGTSAVHLNLPGPVQPPAEPIVLSALATNIPFPFDTSAEGTNNVAELGVFENPTSDTSKPWSEAYYQGEEALFSIMLRVPQHEPWPSHEGPDKTRTSSAATDREVAGE